MTKTVERYACLTFHTEQLHDDMVWKHVKDIVRFLDFKGIRATWFSIAPVHPAYIDRRFSSIKWSQRLKKLNSKNQLIEQHTHFYKKTKGPYDLSRRNLEKRLLEDKRWLESQEFEIKGFVCGGWVINKDLLKLLIIHGYLYDCSISVFKSNHHSIMKSPVFTKFISYSKYLIEIPTFSTLSLKQAMSVFFFKRITSQSNKRPDNRPEFHIFYLHDYALIRLQNRMALRVVVNFLSRKYCRFITTRELMEHLKFNTLPVVDLGVDKNEHI